MSLISVIIVNYNQEKLTIKSINSILKYWLTVKYEIIVIDNNSLKSSLLKNFCSKHNIKFIKSKKNYGLAKAFNIGIKNSKGDYILLFNNDAFFIEKVYFKKLFKFINSLEYNKWIIGFKILNEDLTIQYSIYKYPTLLSFIKRILKYGDELIKDDNIYEQINVFNDKFLKGVVLFFKKELIKDIGGFDENIFLYSEETDFQFRAIKKGYKIIYYPYIKVLHLGSKSTSGSYDKLAFQYVSLLYFFGKHYSVYSKIVLKFIIIIEIGIKFFYFILKDKEKGRKYIKVLKYILRNEK